MADGLPGRIPTVDQVPVVPVYQVRGTEHPARRALAGEVHARPFEVLAAPLRASHLAVVAAAPEPERAHLARLLAAHGAEPPGDGANHFSRDLGPLRLRWERHTEFSTYTFLRFDGFDHPFEGSAAALVPADWLEGLPGQLLTAVHLAVEPRVGEPRERGIDELAGLFDGNMLVGSRVLGAAAEAWTDFHLHADGFGRILVHDAGLSRGQTGRLVQRLLDIETYRMMALLAFPEARRAAAEIGRMDGELGGIVAALAGAEAKAKDGTDDGAERQDRLLLERLTRLAAEAERLDASVGFRLSAARAYYAIVNQRIAELREERIAGVQTVAEFMDRRLAPAMKTCDSAAERQQLLARRVSRAGELLRTRVDIALEEKNRDLLKSMNRRAHLQLRLQETVEGLSVVAISYYLLGLLGYAAKGLKAAGIPIDPEITTLAGVPVVLGLVWLGVRRLRAAIGTHGEEE